MFDDLIDRAIVKGAFSPTSSGDLSISTLTTGPDSGFEIKLGGKITNEIQERLRLNPLALPFKDFIAGQPFVL